MYASDKYMLDIIKNECKKFLTAHINEDYACVVLQIANTFDLEDLQKDALQFMFSHVKSCLKSISFLSLSSECVQLLIESDKLQCTEGFVYQKMIQWAEQQCRKDLHVSANKEQRVTGYDGQHVTANDEQLRKVLGDLIYLIRFPIMTRKYFTNNVSTQNVLTLDEKVEIYQSFDGKVIDTFPTYVRLKLSNAELKVLRCKSHLKTNSSWNQDGADDCLDFTTNFDCYIYGIFVFGSNQHSGQHEVNINILTGSGILGSTSTQFNSVEGYTFYPINLAKPLRILKNIRYTIKLNMKGNMCFSGTGYKTVVKIDDGLTVTFTDSELSPYRTSSTRGQIPGIILSRS